MAVTPNFDIISNVSMNRQYCTFHKALLTESYNNMYMLCTDSNHDKISKLAFENFAIYSILQLYYYYAHPYTPCEDKDLYLFIEKYKEQKELLKNYLKTRNVPCKNC